jgi:hypothetical protein
MILLASVAGLALLSIAALHAAWGFGVTFPSIDEKHLVRLAVGATDRSSMPTPVQCFAVAAAIATAGVLCFLLVTVHSPAVLSWLITIAGLAAAIVFAFRGVATYLRIWRRRFTLEPFATLDRRYYGPLCLLFAVTFAALVSQR